LPAAAIPALGVSLLLAAALDRRGAAELSGGPRWLAHAGSLVAVAASLLVTLPAAGWPLAASLAGAAAVAQLGALADRGARSELRTYTGWASAGLLAAALWVLWSAAGGPVSWAPLLLVALFAAYHALALRVRGRAAELAAGLAGVANIGVPAALLNALWLRAEDVSAGWELALTLWAGAGVYLGLSLARRATPGARVWAAASLIPAALLASLSAAEVPAAWWGTALSLTALAYLGAGVALEPRARPFALPAYAGAGALALIALLLASRFPDEARWSLPVLMALGVAVLLVTHGGRLLLLGDRDRVLIAVCGLALTGALLPWWLWLVTPVSLDTAERGFALLALAALYFAAARWWPGRVRRAYDLALQALGALLVMGGWVLTFTGAGDLPALGALAAAAVWTWQALIRRGSWWAAFALGALQLAAAFALVEHGERLGMGGWVALTLVFAAAYTIASVLLRRGPAAYWSAPLLWWGVFAGLCALPAAALDLTYAPLITPLHVAAAAGLAAQAALVGVAWRLPLTGYLAAPLAGLAVVLAGSRGFFTPWQPEPGDLGFVLCGLTLALVALGQIIRRRAPAYAVPYELVGYAFLTLAPIPASETAMHTSLTWAGVGLLFALAVRLYHLPWAAAPALAAVDVVVLSGFAWLSPGGRPEGAGPILLAAAALQAALGLWARWRSRSLGVLLPPPNPFAATAGSLVPALAPPAYLVALFSASAALTLAWPADDTRALVALGLAALLLALAVVERAEPLGWVALPPLTLGLASVHAALGVPDSWSLAWGVLETLAVYLVGWGAERAGGVVLAPWRRPLSLGPLGVALVACAGLGALAPAAGEIPALTLALAALSLLLATHAARAREVLWVYAAGAALVLAAIGQLYDWGFRRPEFFAAPAGLYLLALGDGLRRFRGWVAPARTVETGGVVLLLGVLLGQSLRADGVESLGYATALCAASLAVLGYGVLAQLRVPFLGGASFFVAGVLWLSVDPLMAANKWLLLGALGLILVGTYVLLERRQDQLVRAGRALAQRIGGWA
jgi:hypothetical protein